MQSTPSLQQIINYMRTEAYKTELLSAQPSPAGPAGAGAPPSPLHMESDQRSTPDESDVGGDCSYSRQEFMPPMEPADELGGFSPHSDNSPLSRARGLDSDPNIHLNPPLLPPPLIDYWDNVINLADMEERLARLRRGRDPSMPDLLIPSRVRNDILRRYPHLLKEACDKLASENRGARTFRSRVCSLPREDEISDASEDSASESVKTIHRFEGGEKIRIHVVDERAAVIELTCSCHALPDFCFLETIERHRKIHDRGPSPRYRSGDTASPAHESVSYQVIAKNIS